MPQTWTGWAQTVLADIPAPATAENVRFLTAWHGFELSGAQNNPLNTTQREKGSTSFNSVGVQNYPTTTLGAHATAQTLTNGFYGNIVAALKEGNPYTYPDRAAVGREITTWGTPNFAASYLGQASPPTPGPIILGLPAAVGKSYPVNLVGGPCNGRTVYLASDVLSAGMTACGGKVYRYAPDTSNPWIFQLASDQEKGKPVGQAFTPQDVFTAFHTLMYTLSHRVPAGVTTMRADLSRLRKAVR